MNIKDEQVHQMAKKLAHITGESVTQAVSTAIRERLERMQEVPMSERLRRIGEECAPRLQGLPDHAEFLYGDDGLPR